VITAAHCCTNSASYYQIVAGDHSLSDIDEGTEQVRDVAVITPHPDYNDGGPNDVCMLTLREPLNLNSR
jgi:hypothetical protein